MADEAGGEAGRRGLGRAAAIRAAAHRFAPGLEAPVDPTREVGQLASVGLFDQSEHDHRLVVGNGQPVADQGEGRALGPASVGADQRCAPGQQGFAEGSGLVCRARAASLPDIVGRSVRIGTGGRGGVKGWGWRCRRRGRTIRGGDGG
ncbi:hypothetical protein CIW48_19325 [Methylobacterium sp. P1-11]|nr:hypothetical protein CIW48_19325 [Methylobacterium sp. P1-11]